MGQHEAVVSNLIQELRRGSLVLLVLSQMDRKQYGYSLLQDLADYGITIEAGTLYPLMRRLEKQGLLKSEWDLEGGRPRKYYLLSDTGTEALKQMEAEWQQLSGQIDRLLKGHQKRNMTSKGE